MVIKASSAAEIRQLVDALAGPDDVAREAAAARLRVIGPRAIDRLLAVYSKGGSPAARATVLRVLEPIADARCVDPARAALGDPAEDVATAAAAVLRGLVDAPDPRLATEALDALVAAAVDGQVTAQARRIAAEALRDLPAAVQAGVAVALAPDVPLAAAGSPSATTDIWSAAIGGSLPDKPGQLREPLARHAADASLATLQKLVDILRGRESSAGAQATEWLALRGAVHQALAARGSRIALYDLRETLERSSSPLPVSFLSALHTIGDRSCLEPLAEAHAHAPGRETWWRQQLASAFQAIMVRESLTVKSAAVRKIVARWPEIVA